MVRQLGGESRTDGKSFDIGRSNLNSYRQGLAITGPANINTDGYKRRDTELEELSASKASVLAAGSGMGVRIGTIRRAFDEFLLNKAQFIAYSESTSHLPPWRPKSSLSFFPVMRTLATIGGFFEDAEIASADLIGRTVPLGRRQVSDKLAPFVLDEMKGGLFTWPSICWMMMC